MTAIHAIVQPQIQTAWIISDAAFTDQWGRLVAIGPKVLVGSGSEPWALGIMGDVAPLFVQQAVMDFVAMGFGQVGKFLPMIAKRAIEKQRCDWPDGAREPELHLFLTGWDSRRRGMALLTLSSVEMDAAPAVEPFEVYEQPWVLSLGGAGTMRELLGRKVDLADPACFDPSVEAVRIISRQREVPYRRPSQGDGHVRPGYAVGGAVWLTKVTPGGVEQSVLHRFPDLVGYRIDPHRGEWRAWWAKLRGIRA